MCLTLETSLEHAYSGIVWKRCCRGCSYGWNIIITAPLWRGLVCTDDVISSPLVLINHLVISDRIRRAMLRWMYLVSSDGVWHISHEPGERGVHHWSKILIESACSPAAVHALATALPPVILLLAIAGASLLRDKVRATTTDLLLFQLIHDLG